MYYRKLSEFERERYELALWRVREIAEGGADALFAPDFFRGEAVFLLKSEKLRADIEAGKDRDWTLPQLEERNQLLYEEILI